jgi:carbon monoxide dehydrogenase subunit G
MAIEFDNSFTVPVPQAQAWDLLLDVERIAPCLPGASVSSVTGDEAEGEVKVKLGPLSLTYRGTARFTAQDQAGRTFAIEASGQETRGEGTAAASLRFELKPTRVEDSTLVAIHTTLDVTGRPAEFGRSLLPEVSGKAIAHFAANLETQIVSGAAAAAPAPAVPPAYVPAATPAPVAASTATGDPAEPEDSLDAFRYAVVPVLKRAVPVVGAVAVGAVLFAVIRRLSGKKSS